MISCFNLRDTSDGELAEGLSSFRVTEARRITTRRGGVTIPAGNVILTFDANELSSTVTVGYIRVRVRIYVPKPMRCFKCQRFGHTKVHCRNRPVCAKCASNDHQEGDCDSDTFRCINCVAAKRPDASHASLDRSCPSLMKETEIIPIKTTRNISFREARDIYERSRPSVSYAQTVKTPVTAKTTLEEMSATQLLRLLKSFGLSVVASGTTPTSVEPEASTNFVAPLSAAAGLPSPSPPFGSGGGGTAATPAASVDEDDVGWTEVQRRRKAGEHRLQAASTPSTLAPSGPSGSAVMESLLRAEDERRAREARRARVAEKAREVRRSTEAVAAPASQGLELPRSSPAGRPAMGPPPPPPPLRRPAPPPGAGRGVLERLGKRSLPRGDSPTEEPSPRARQRFLPGATAVRSSSADGRLRRGHTHTPIQIEESQWSDETDHV